MGRLLRNRWHVKYGSPAPIEHFNMLIHGADLFDYREVFSIEELAEKPDIYYPSYLNFLDDADNIYDRGYNIYTLLSPYIIIPVTDVNYLINFSSIGIGPFEHDFETHEDHHTEVSFNEQFQCQACIIASNDDTTIYWCEEFKLLDDEICDVFIILLPNKCSIRMQTTSIYEVKHWEFGFTPAKHAHITWLGFAMGSENGNYYKIRTEDGLYFPDLGLTDINLYKLRYNNPEIKVGLFNSMHSGTPIVQFDNDLVLHIAYTLTGYSDIDDTIRNCCMYYISSEIEITELIDMIELQIQECESYAEYSLYVHEPAERIEHMVLQLIYPWFDLNPMSTIGFPGDTMSFDNGSAWHGKEYSYLNGFIFSAAEEYPDQPVIFAEDWIDGKTAYMYPFMMFMRFSYELCQLYIGTSEKEYLELDLCYSDDGTGLIHIPYDPGIRVNIQDYIFEETIYIVD